jgi:hypothetical protein
MNVFRYGAAGLYLLGHLSKIVNFSATNSQACGIISNHQLAAGFIREC